MTDVGLILHKLQRLRDQVALARDRRPDAAEVLTRDLVLCDALALAFLVAVQECVDIAYHVAAEERWGVPDSHAAAFELLADHGVLDRELVTALTGTARVRNRIAHGYASVDHVRMWEELPAGLESLEAFCTRVAAWLPPEPK
jgi:uncharacterized protein YutE (UPF0331/DUF86 family)